MAACANCGRPLPPGGKFCPGCGTAQPQTAPSSPPKIEPASTPNIPTPVSPATGATPVNIEALITRLVGFVRSLSRWDAAALIGGGAGAGLWYGWSAMDVKDTVTPKYIMLIPIIIVIFRKPLDALLRPLQMIKNHIPRLILIAAGLAAPYLMAHYFYRHGTSNFPLAQKSIVWGTIVSYAILRIPTPRLALPRIPTALLTSWLFWFGLLLTIQWLLPDLVFGDDFTRDFRRLEDGLRTPGWAEGIAGTAGTVISGLVNGALVFQSGDPSTPSDSGEQPTRYTMDVRTEDERTSLAADGLDRLWVYAQILCSKPEVDAKGLTAGITFSFQGTYTNWISIKQQQFVGSYKSILLAAEPPTPDAELGDDAKVTVQVSGATADGEPIEVPVELALDEALEMKVDILA